MNRKGAFTSRRAPRRWGRVVLHVAFAASFSGCRDDALSRSLEVASASPPLLPPGDKASTPGSRWPEPAPLELYTPPAIYTLSPDLLKGQSELVGEVVKDGALFHNYSKGCAWKSYGVRRQGDEGKGLFFLTWDECGDKKPARDLSRLTVGKSYRFVLGPPSHAKDHLQILDAIAVGAPPFPPCTKTPTPSLALRGLTDTEVQARFGKPDRVETYRAADRVGGIYGPLNRAYPPTMPDNRFVHIDEWAWRVDDCILTVWFHVPGTEWRVLDDSYRHKDKKP